MIYPYNVATSGYLDSPLAVAASGYLSQTVVVAPPPPPPAAGKSGALTGGGRYDSSRQLSDLERRLREQRRREYLETVKRSDDDFIHIAVRAALFLLRGK